MDSKQFDELVARLASTASRRNAVKGVIGGTLASVGVTSVASTAKGNGKGKKHGHNKQPLCHCPDSDPSHCVTLNLPRKARKKHLKNHPFDRPGVCPYG